MSFNFLRNNELDLDNVIIESPRCIIKPFHIEWTDFEDLSSAFCGANENLFISEYLPSAEQERDYIWYCIEKRSKGKAIEFFVYDKKSNILIGSVWINEIDSGEPNVWLWIRKELHGKWYGTELYSAIIEWTKKETNFTFLKHVSDLDNSASIKLAERFKWKLQETLNSWKQAKYYIMLD